MALQMMQPPIVKVPHLGEIRATHLTINLVIWIQKEAHEKPIFFLKEYLSEKCSYLDESDIDAKNLTDKQLDEIASALAPVLCREDNEDDDAASIQTARQLKMRLDEKIEEMETRTTEIMKRTFKNLDFLNTPSMRLHKAINPPGLTALRNAMKVTAMPNLSGFMNPSYMDHISEFQKSQNRIHEMLKIVQPTTSVGSEIARLHSQILPRDDVFKTLSILNKQLSFLTPSVGSAIKSVYPKHLTDDYFLKGLKLPGFELTAQAGLTGLAPKAVSAEILSKYESDVDDGGSGFDVTLNTIRALDGIDQDNPEDIIELGRSASAQITSLSPQNRALLIQFITMLIAALSLFAVMNDNSEELLEQGVGELKAIYEQTQTHIRQEEDRYKYDRVLSSRYHLREGPSKDSDSIIILNTDRLLRIIETEGNWAYVVVYPYGSEPELRGWVYRYGLKPLIYLK